MSVLDKAQAHYREAITGELIPIDVPEWDCTLYFRRSGSMAEHIPVLEAYQSGTAGDAYIAAVIAYALDEKGNRVFNKNDRQILLRSVDRTVLQRIANEITGGEVDEEDAEKN